MKHRPWLAAFLALVLVAGAVCPPAASARYQPSGGMDFFSRDQEIQAGRQAAAQIPRQMPVLPDSDPISRYIQRLGGELAAHAPGERWPYNFHVINVKAINAFALPGGPVFVNMGAIQAADNEAQLAGVLSHEISHVVQRHATRAATKRLMAQAPLTVLSGLLGGSLGGQLARYGISFGAGSYFLRNSRKSESEADLVGTDIMYDAGYDPRQMAVFFEKLEAQGGAHAPQFLSDHPNPGNRAVAVMDEVGTLPRKSSYRQDSAEFRQIKQLVMGRAPAAPQRSGEQRLQPAAGVSPDDNGGFRILEQSGFRISYPESWQVSGGLKNGFAIGPVPDGSYGVVIGQSPTHARDLNQQTEAVISAIQQSNAGIKTVGKAQDIRVNGVSGKSVDLLNAGERQWLVTLAHGENGMYLLFRAPEAQFDQMRPTFEVMVKSFHLQ
jgi:predicted Zn-dependent protease